MRKSYLYLIAVVFIIIVASIALYTTHKTYYLNLPFCDIENTGDYEGLYNEKMPSCMEVIGIDLKSFSDGTKIIDKRVINSVIDYLNNVQLVRVAGNFDKSTRVFVIKELSAQGYDFIKGDKEKDALLRFYNESQIEIGTIKIYDEKYVCDSNYRAYKVRNESVSIIRDLEKLMNH